MSPGFSEVGINLAAVNYWATEFPFIDRMKSAGDWVAVEPSGRAMTAEVPLDANGYPTSMPDGAKYIYTMVEVDPVELAMTDRYVLTYNGSANILAVGAKIISSSAGEIVFEAAKDSKFVQLKISDIDPENTLSGMSFVREDQVDLFESGAIFNPELIEKIDPFSTLRFMDWGSTNNADIMSWDDRAMLEDRSWAAKEGSVPIEIMVALSNQTNKNMWINIPAEADDNYVRELLSYVRDNLDPQLKVHVEYSNEVWNFGFGQAQSALKKGNQLWGTDVNGDGVIDQKNSAEHVSDGWLQYYGYRTAQVASIANSVFSGDDDERLEMVFATTPGSGGSSQIMKGVEKAGVGTASQLFDEYAIHAYFGNFGTGTAADADILLGWARDGAAGVDAAFKELHDGALLSSTHSILEVLDGIKAHAAVAARLGLDLVAYEGGVSMIASKVAAADRADLTAFYSKLLNDPRMGELYRQVVDAFSAAGGTEFLAYNDASSSTGVYGQWGALDHIYQDSSVRYDVLVELAERGRAANSSVTAQADRDVVIGTDLADNITDLVGHNKLFGGGGADTLTSGAGNDHIFGHSANGGTDSGDLISAGGGSDYVNGNAGNDTINGGEGSDRIQGGQGDDSISGDAGNDTLNGNRGNDLVMGGEGNDSLRGGQDNDTLNGGNGNDILSGDLGIDELTGGAGIDRFIFSGSGSPLGPTVDTVTDFEQGTDMISLGFTPTTVLVGNTSYASIDAARGAAQSLLDGRAGNGEVAAVALSGGSTLLFWSSSRGATIDSVAAFQNQIASDFGLIDFV